MLTQAQASRHKPLMTSRRQFLLGETFRSEFSPFFSFFFPPFFEANCFTACVKPVAWTKIYDVCPGIVIGIDWKKSSLRQTSPERRIWLCVSFFSVSLFVCFSASAFSLETFLPEYIPVPTWNKLTAISCVRQVWTDSVAFYFCFLSFNFLFLWKQFLTLQASRLYSAMMFSRFSV